jgi:hypothetical protein
MQVILGATCWFRSFQPFRRALHLNRLQLTLSECPERELLTLFRINRLERRMAAITADLKTKDLLLGMALRLHGFHEVSRAARAKGHS